MMKHLITCSILILAAAHLHAQHLLWSKHYLDSTGGDYLRIIEAVNGGFIATGQTILDSTSTSGVHTYVMHIADDGTLLRDNIIDELPGDIPRWIFPRGRDGYYLVGGAMSGGLSIALIDTALEFVSSKAPVVNGDVFFFGNARATSDHGFVVVGGISLNPNDPSVASRVRKFDRDGELQWDKRFAPANSFGPRSVRQLSDGSYVVVGTGLDTQELFDISVTRLSSTGDSLWSTYVGTEMSDNGFDVVERRDGGLLIVGITSDSFAQTVLLWLDASSGAVERQVLYDTVGAYQIERASGSGYLMETYGPFSSPIVKINEDGEIAWVHTPTHFANAATRFILPLDDGRIALAGAYYQTGMRIAMLRDGTSGIEEIKLLPCILDFW